MNRTSEILVDEKEGEMKLAFRLRRETGKNAGVVQVTIWTIAIIVFFSISCNMRRADRSVSSSTSSLFRRNTNRVHSVPLSRGSLSLEGNESEDESFGLSDIDVSQDIRETFTRLDTELAAARAEIASFALITDDAIATSNIPEEIGIETNSDSVPEVIAENGESAANPAVEENESHLSIKSFQSIFLPAAAKSGLQVLRVRGSCYLRVRAGQAVQQNQTAERRTRETKNTC